MQLLSALPGSGGGDSIGEVILEVMTSRVGAVGREAGSQAGWPTTSAGSAGGSGWEEGRADGCGEMVPTEASAALVPDRTHRTATTEGEGGEADAAWHLLCAIPSAVHLFPRFSSAHQACVI